MRLLAAVGTGLLAACASAAPHPASAGPAAQVASPIPVTGTAHRIVFPDSVQQGALVIGKVPAGSRVSHDGHDLKVTPYGTVAFGVARTEDGPVSVEVIRPDGHRETVSVAVTPRDWPVERVDGVPGKTVNPPPAIAKRIAREQAAVTAARTREDARTGFAQDFIWPVRGRISGRFGNQRIYNGTPGSAHSGMDIAAASGTPVKAPADGLVTFAGNLYLTGGTILLDHGHGVSSNFLHLSRMDVAVGDSVKQGEIIGRVGATGRATGPHLHWGMNWLTVRIDPLLMIEASDAAQP